MLPTCFTLYYLTGLLIFSLAILHIFIPSTSPITYTYLTYICMHVATIHLIYTFLLPLLPLYPPVHSGVFGVVDQEAQW